MLKSIYEIVENVVVFFETVWDLIESLRKLLEYAIKLFPSPYAEMTLATLGIIFIIIIYKLVKGGKA